MKDNSLEILKYIEIAKKKHKEGKIYQANEIYKKLINQKIYTYDLLFSYGLFNKEINNLKIAKNLFILADIKKEIKKTKDFNNFLVKNKLLNALIISDVESLKNIIRSARNIKNLKLIKQEGANIFDLFKYKNIIITSTSAKKMQERILNEKN